MEEHRQEAIGLVAFAGEQPVKVGVRAAALERQHQPAPGHRQGQRTPMVFVDDGVARKQNPGETISCGKSNTTCVENPQSRLVIVKQNDPLLCLEVGQELLLRTRLRNAPASGGAFAPRIPGAVRSPR